MSTNDHGTSEQKVRQEVGDLTITDAIPIRISVLAPDGTTLYANRRVLDRIGLTLDEVKSEALLERTCRPEEVPVNLPLQLRARPVSDKSRLAGTE
jgi:PAS domain-containing protein